MRTIEIRMIPFYIGLILCLYVLWKALWNFGNSYRQHDHHLAGVLRSLEVLAAKQSSVKPTDTSPPTARNIQAQANAFLQDSGSAESEHKLQPVKTPVIDPLKSPAAEAGGDTRPPVDESVSKSASGTDAHTAPQHQQRTWTSTGLLDVDIDHLTDDAPLVADAGNADRAMIEEMPAGTLGFAPVTVNASKSPNVQPALIENLLADADKATAHSHHAGGSASPASSVDSTVKAPASGVIVSDGPAHVSAQVFASDHLIASTDRSTVDATGTELPHVTSTLASSPIPTSPLSPEGSAESEPVATPESSSTEAHTIVLNKQHIAADLQTEQPQPAAFAQSPAADEIRPFILRHSQTIVEPMESEDIQTDTTSSVMATTDAASVDMTSNCTSSADTTATNSAPSAMSGISAHNLSDVSVISDISSPTSHLDIPSVVTVHATADLAIASNEKDTAVPIEKPVDPPVPPKQSGPVFPPANKDEYNRINIDFRQPMPRPKVIGTVIDFHCHLLNANHARDWFESAEHYGIDTFVTMCPLEEATRLHREHGDKLQFIAVPAWKDVSGNWYDNFLNRLESFYNLGSRIVKFHVAPGTMAMRKYRLDSPEFLPIFREIAARKMGVMTHVGDPDTWYNGKYADTEKFGTRDAHYQMWEEALERHPQDSPWIGAHLGGNPEDLHRLQKLLNKFPNLYLDNSATRWMVREISKQRETAREFFIRNQDRIIFGSDQVSGDDRGFDFLASRFWCHRKLWETAYIGPSPILDPDLPNDNQPVMAGLALPDEVLQKLYHDNAMKVLKMLGVECGW